MTDLNHLPARGLHRDQQTLAPDRTELRATVAVDKTADRKDTLPDSLGGAWDRGADFVARHPGMSAEYVRAANPFRTSELAHMREARDNARAEVERLTAVVRRVRELHRESRGSMSALYPSLICECGKDYPCPTIRALAAAGGVS